MSEILKVLNKQNVELKSEVVELGIVDDFALDAEANTAMVKRTIGEMLDLKKKKEKLVSSVNIAEKLISETEKKLVEIEKQIKFLGVEKPAKVKKAEKELQDNKKVIAKLLKDTKSI